MFSRIFWNYYNTIITCRAVLLYSSIFFAISSCHTWLHIVHIYSEVLEKRDNFSRPHWIYFPICLTLLEGIKYISMSTLFYGTVQIAVPNNSIPPAHSCRCTKFSCFFLAFFLIILKAAVKSAETIYWLFFYRRYILICYPESHFFFGFLRGGFKFLTRWFHNLVKRTNISFGGGLLKLLIIK